MIGWYKHVVFANYANFSGRARRAEYWWFALANLLIVLALELLIALVAAATSPRVEQPASPIAVAIIGVLAVAILLYVLALLVPSVAVNVRRLHDIDKSGWWIFIALVPFVGALVLLVFHCMPGTRGPNRFGADLKTAVDVAAPVVFSP